MENYNFAPISISGLFVIEERRANTEHHIPQKLKNFAYLTPMNFFFVEDIYYFLGGVNLYDACTSNPPIHP